MDMIAVAKVNTDMTDDSGSGIGMIEHQVARLQLISWNVRPFSFLTVAVCRGAADAVTYLS
jgi:hypothetical protein